ncbi:hypothetical protein O6H91_13G034900 [Diphasiastrum complanatum]|uniref:Uncharacterized protein n=1 Tax=Diphasiastrum complanatum TaxID=34168 RepID=A0ACC2BTT2_DIPCM|nr:hypothetical protein O6H91_Y229400 [Diphasiastrum complanatum]KAJ7533146.1 hypothetical protein O6H91_13G034900 [Diphasiastrum complanatum]
MIGFLFSHEKQASMAALCSGRLLASSPLYCTPASFQASFSPSSTSHTDSFKFQILKGCVASAFAKFICSRRKKGFVVQSDTNSRKSGQVGTRSSAELSSFKRFASPLSPASFAYKETEECVSGEFCPLYSSRGLLAFSANLLPGRTICMAATNDKDVLIANGNVGIAECVKSSVRTGRVQRSTKETNVDVSIGLDGNGCCDCDTGIPFLDHMLDQLASHGLFDLSVKAQGDVHIDDHHTNEDVALALGTALLQALGDRKGIYRFGDFSAPLDEALIHVALDLSGRPYLGYNLEIPTDHVGSYDTQLVEHFFQSLVNTSGMTLHIRQLSGRNSHHIVEATFKAFAKALRQAIEYDIRRKGTIPSSKGVLSRS